MKTERNHGKCLTCWIWTACFIVLMFQACGKKGDPVPPRLILPPAVSDLKVSMVNGVVNLVWSMPDENADVSRIKILRSGVEVAGENCPECPRIYAPVDDLYPRDSRIMKDGGGRVARYVDAGVRQGWLYSYKIVSCDSYGNCSRDSNVAEIKVKE